MTLPRASTHRVLVGLLLPAAVLAAQPATRPDAGPSPAAAPATRPTSRPTLFGNRLVRLRDLGLAAPDWPSPGRNANVEVSDDEWRQIAAFAKDNFPNRWEAFEQLETRRGRDNPLVKQLRDRITGRYRLLMRIKLYDTMPAGLYDAAITQGKLEDEAWAAVRDARRQPKDAGAQKRQREKVEALVKNLLTEKQARLETLKQTLADEQEQLDADKANVSQVVDRQIARLSGDDPNAGRGGFGGGPGRGFPRGWDRPEPGEYKYAPPPATQPD